MPNSQMKTELLESLFLEALQKGQQVKCRVYSGSMRPTFQIGDLLTVDSCQPKVGEVAVYTLNSHWVTHRVIKIQKESFLLKGDAFQPGGEEEIHESRVIGRVVEHQRDLRARQINILRKALKRCPQSLRSLLWNIIPESTQDYIREKSLSDVGIIAE
jgi:signal peptidase I